MNTGTAICLGIVAILFLYLLRIRKRDLMNPQPPVVDTFTRRERLKWDLVGVLLFVLCVPIVLGLFRGLTVAIFSLRNHLVGPSLAAASTGYGLFRVAEMFGVLVIPIGVIYFATKMALGDRYENYLTAGSPHIKVTVKEFRALAIGANSFVVLVYIAALAVNLPTFFALKADEILIGRPISLVIKHYKYSDVRRISHSMNAKALVAFKDGFEWSDEFPLELKDQERTELLKILSAKTLLSIEQQIE